MVIHCAFTKNWQKAKAAGGWFEMRKLEIRNKLPDYQLICQGKMNNHHFFFSLEGFELIITTWPHRHLLLTNGQKKLPFYLLNIYFNLMLTWGARTSESENQAKAKHLLNELVHSATLASIFFTLFSFSAQPNMAIKKKTAHWNNWAGKISNTAQRFWYSHEVAFPDESMWRHITKVSW